MFFVITSYLKLQLQSSVKLDGLYNLMEKKQLVNNVIMMIIYNNEHK